MKFLGLLLLMTFAAQAQPITVKERLRLSLWFEGIETKPVKKMNSRKNNPLPEELERALWKI